MDDDKITMAELEAMYGKSIPIEAAHVLVDPTLTADGARRALERIASDGRALAIARECVAALSDGWGHDEEQRAVDDLLPIISKHL